MKTREREIILFNGEAYSRPGLAGRDHPPRTERRRRAN